MVRHWLVTRRARLEREREIVRDYLALRLEVEDWNGCQTALADIREIDAQLRVIGEAEVE